MTSSAPSSKTPHVAWAPTHNPRLGAIHLRQGQQLDSKQYLVFLLRRVRKMIQVSEPETATRDFLNQLERAGLLDQSLPRTVEAQMLDNEALREKLHHLGVMPSPQIVKDDNLEAQKLIQETTLEQWLSDLVGNQSEHLD